MSTAQKREARRIVRRMLAATDRILTSARELERARQELRRLSKEAAQ